MPLKTFHSFSVATTIQHGLLRKLNVPQPWWRQKYPYPRISAASIAVTPRRSRPNIPVSDHSSYASNAQHHSSGTIISSSETPISDSLNAGDASKDVPSSPPAYGKAQPFSGMTTSLTNMANGTDEIFDPEANAVPPANEEEVKEVLSKPPPVNSDYLPLPWKGRLGYVSSPCCNAFILWTGLTSRPRHVFVPTFEIRTLQSSVPEHAGSHPYWKTAIR